MPIRLACTLLLWFSALPLLLSLPPMVGAAVWAIPGLAGIAALLRPLPRLGLVALTGVAILTILSIQSGSGDVRGTGLGLLVAVILMKATEMRTTRDGYNTVGFSLICPFVAFVMDVGLGWTTFVAVVSLVGTMVLAGMLIEWQDRRPVKPWTHHLARVAKLGILALPLAAVAFWATPRLDSPLWGMAAGHQSQTGVGDSMAPGDVSRLMKDPSTAFRVDFEGDAPTSGQMYWRGMTLGYFDGRAWTPTLTDTGVPAFDPASTQAVATAEKPAWTYTLTMEPTRQRFVFVLEQMVGQVGSLGRVFSDNTLQARVPLTSLTVWRDLGASPHALLEPESLSDEDRFAYTQLPDGYNPRTIALAKQWRDEGLDDRAMVERALEMFGERFTYSLNPPLLGRHSVDEFMFETRVGFCEHFSSSFAVLMRAAGIPTRVVVGYQGGEENNWGGYWRVRQADAHAWNEVWLEGKGWVRADPTFSVSERIPSEGQERRLLRGLGGNGAFADWLRQSWVTAFRDFDAQRQRGLMEKVGLQGVPPLLAAGVAATVLLLVVGGVFLTFLRTKREKKPAELRAWKALLRRLERRGYGGGGSETPLNMAKRVGMRLSSASQAEELMGLARQYCAWRYEGKPSPGLVRRLKSFRPGRARK